MLRSHVDVRILVLSVVLAAPVAALEIETSHKPGFDYGTLRTYAWEYRAELGPNHPLAEGSPLDLLIRQAGDRALLEAGFERVASEAAGAPPDFRVSYVGFVLDKLEIEGTRREIAEGVAWIGDPGAHSQLAYQEGTLVIEIRADGAKDVIWSGWAREVARTPERLRRRAEKAAFKILRHFPPE
jgi:hypothetical protein